MHVSGRDAAGEIRALELIEHPFFICTLFQIERSTLKGESHPLIEAFIKTASGFANMKLTLLTFFKSLQLFIKIIILCDVIPTVIISLQN